MILPPMNGLSRLGVTFFYTIMLFNNVGLRLKKIENFVNRNEY